MISGTGAVQLAHEGGRHHVARRETPATSRRFDIAELLEEARRVEGRAHFQRAVAGVSGLDLEILGQPRSNAVAAEQRVHEYGDDAGGRAWCFADAPGHNADHVRPHPGAIGTVAEQYIRVVRTAYEFGEGFHIGVRIVVLGAARECRPHDIARRRQMIDAQGTDLHQGEETVGEGRTEHRRVEVPIPSQTRRRANSERLPSFTAVVPARRRRSGLPTPSSHPHRRVSPDRGERPAPRTRLPCKSSRAPAPCDSGTPT